jgi:adenosylcobinamide-GDP ribazoletransferase
VGHLRVGGLVAASVVAVGFTAFTVLRMDLRSAVLLAVLLAGVSSLTYLGKWYLHRKLGGITGDTIGAVTELSEVLVFFIFTIFAS